MACVWKRTKRKKETKGRNERKKRKEETKGFQSIFLPIFCSIISQVLIQSKKREEEEEEWTENDKFEWSLQVFTDIIKKFQFKIVLSFGDPNKEV